MMSRRRRRRRLVLYEGHNGCMQREREIQQPRASLLFFYSLIYASVSARARVFILQQKPCSSSSVYYYHYYTTVCRADPLKVRY